MTQFVAIGEIERWTLATGESIFDGMARLTRRPFWPWFFLVATLVSFFWPGWASQAAEFARITVNAVAGREVLGHWQPLALFMLAFIVSIGQVPDALLSGEQFPTLLIAVAYAGSGGTLLLAAN